VTDSPIAVLDIDGTLIDSNYQHALAWYRALRLVGETYPVWRLHRLVPASSGQRRHVNVFLDKLDARGLADGWTSSADVKASKPAPDLPRVALEKLGAPPEAPSVMVGDSVWDVEAAGKAGMPAIVVRSGGFGDDELRKAGAMAIYDTPGDLAKALDDTPLA
jgi:phosphoglycolate phosphatase-like HAD superfamily hydrolase